MPRRASASPAPPPEACVARGRAFPGVPRRSWRAGPRSPLRVAASRPRPPAVQRPVARLLALRVAASRLVRRAHAAPGSGPAPCCGLRLAGSRVPSGVPRRVAARPVPAHPSAARAAVPLRLRPAPGFRCGCSRGSTLRASAFRPPLWPARRPVAVSPPSAAAVSWPPRLCPRRPPHWPALSPAAVPRRPPQSYPRRPRGRVPVAPALPVSLGGNGCAQRFFSLPFPDSASARRPSGV